MHPVLARTRALLILLLTAVTATLLLADPASAAGVHYVALGDSYSSGVGAGDYTSESGDCDRSPYAYSALWAGAHSPASYTSVACAGATTADVETSQLSAVSTSTTLVSITVGGNDENFATVMQDCNLKDDDACVSEIDAAENNARTALPGKLSTLFGDVAARAPGARLVVLDYPRFYDLDHDCIGLSQTKRAKIDEAIDVLDGVLAAASSRAGAAFAEVRTAFTGHEICDSARWLHSVNVGEVSESYHPTADGHADAYFPAFTAVA